MAFKDLTGQRFGRLTVIDRADTQNGHVRWRCRCDCGNITIVKGIHLKNGRTKSCGCLIEETTRNAHSTHRLSNRDDLMIDRIDVNGNYEPSNCRWADRRAQNNNRRNNHYLTYNGETKTMRQWADDLGISYYALRSRINKGRWSVERALNEPTKGGK